MKATDLKLSVIGLGKLGACMAAVFADKDFDVIGVDLNEDLVKAINDGRAPVEEPGLEQLIARNAQRLCATTEITSAVKQSDASFIIVPTPSDDQGIFTTKYVETVVEGIAKALKDKDSYHLIAITSTVMPGDTGGPLQAILEDVSGKQCGRDFGLCYSPEFIALGTVIRDMQEPDFLLIGEGDKRSGDMLESILVATHKSACPVSRMNFVNAELTKIAVNTYVTTKISYANMLAQICETLPNADANVVSEALGHDTRIGPKYLTGALAYGGPCFPRDNVAFAAMARMNGVEAIIAEATERQNQSQRAHLCRLVRDKLPESGRVAILGLSYKPGTVVVDCSPGLEIVRELQCENIPMILYDPRAMDNARKALDCHQQIQFATSAKEAVQGASVTVITVPWPEFKSLSPGDFQLKNSQSTIIDCWRILCEQTFASTCDYITVGRGPRL
jgi:UDPglucose 6-dehydrogenase